jgi:23S rRNA (uracil1939-C5)-methyltransferase
VAVTKRQKNFLEARLVRVLEPSVLRRDPPCPVVNECGGCPWQHIQYEEQLKQKEDFLRRSLRTWITTENDLGIKVLPSAKEFRYRNRIQLQVQNKRLGYFKKGSHDLVELNDCHIAGENFVNRAHQWMNANSNPAIRKIEIKTDSVKDISTSFPEFSQVNNDINEKMTAHMLAEFESWLPANPAAVYDFFSGDGNFTFPLAKLLKQSVVVAVESSTDASGRGARKIEEHDRSRISFVNQTCDEYLKTHPMKRESLILADPPRAGLSRFFIEQILNSKPKVFVYVSCNLGTLERDLKHLTESGDLRVTKVLGFDMFPQTEYVETVVTLTAR